MSLSTTCLFTRHIPSPLGKDCFSFVMVWRKRRREISEPYLEKKRGPKPYLLLCHFWLATQERIVTWPVLWLVPPCYGRPPFLSSTFSSSSCHTPFSKKRPEVVASRQSPYLRSPAVVVDAVADEDLAVTSFLLFLLLLLLLLMLLLLLFSFLLLLLFCCSCCCFDCCFCCCSCSWWCCCFCCCRPGSGRSVCCCGISCYRGWVLPFRPLLMTSLQSLGDLLDFSSFTSLQLLLLGKTVSLGATRTAVGSTTLHNDEDHPAPTPRSAAYL